MQKGFLNIFSVFLQQSAVALADELEERLAKAWALANSPPAPQQQSNVCLLGANRQKRRTPGISR
jgi:hypothetical protein